MISTSCRLTVVGEAVVDLLPDGPRVGGSPLNVAVGLVRAGVPARLITCLGDDAYGALVREHLAQAGVELIAAPATRTATARVRLRDGEAAYELDVPWELPPGPLPPTDWLHVGSLGAVLDPGRSAVAQYVDEARAHGTPISYDPNLRPGLVDAAVRDRVRALGARADLVKLSEADARLLAPGREPADTARGLRGCGVVVLTRGAAGARWYDDVQEIEVPAVPVVVVDTIGAGDAFMAGLLASRGEGPEKQLSAAAASAALNCSRSGA